MAPCLSSSIGALIERYGEMSPKTEIICYFNGYKGLLLGESVRVSSELRAQARLLQDFGGSPIGNSRVKLVNIEDCLKRGLVKEGQDPQMVAAEQLKKDGVDVLHTIGGDDTNIAAAQLVQFLDKINHNVTVIGLPKTVDNDVFPISQTLGAATAAEQGAVFFEHIVAEQSANPRMLIVHEVMGRSCGWLTAVTARVYKERLSRKVMLSQLGFSRDRFDIHGIFIPEMQFNIEAEAERLRAVMDKIDCVNIFVSEGAGTQSIIKEMKDRGEELSVDAFGHVSLSQVNPGEWFGKQFASMIGAEKTLVQKSGYFARASAPIFEDKYLIKGCVDLAVECAFLKKSGVIGHDNDHGNQLRCIEFERIKGGKPFDIKQVWFQRMLENVGQNVVVSV